MNQQKKWIRRKPETMLDWMIIIFSAIAFYMMLNKGGFVLGMLGGVVNILAPFAGGVVIAYAINPMDSWLMKNIFRGQKKLHWLSMLIAYLVAFVLVIGLVYLIVTQVFDSIRTFASNLGGYTKNLEAALLALTERWPELQPYLGTAIDYVQDLSTIVSDLLRMAMGYIPQIMGYFSDVTSTFVAVFTALASSIYLLTQKGKLLRHARILTRAFLPRNAAETTLRICHTANKNLSGFFTGKIIDSAIIGVLTYLSMLIFGMPYAPLISIIVGITNIIPVFGPFIGAVPGIIILLFLDPVQALWFALLILVIQQLDGNVIGPKILGDSIGISALWVLFAIVVFGDLFGLVGMVIGVPVFATLLGLVKEFAEWCLRYRGIDKEGRPLNADGSALPPTEPEEPEEPHTPVIEKVRQTITQQRMKQKQNRRARK
ncbi:MAG: AI-2E family transporter [Clostridiales bacterium]|nr:AI-2E family transporter [Clostridiales bacterium]